MNEPVEKELETIDKIVVGLGNPGQKYSGTRHNLGYRALDEFLRLIEVKKEFLAGSRSRTQFVNVVEKKILLVRPTTWMNLSGSAVESLLLKYSLGISDVLVVQDEMDIECGRAKMRLGGGASGHKGVGDIIEKCGADFTRIKIGIGFPPYSVFNSDIDWVLGKPTEEEEKQFINIMPVVAEGIMHWIMDGPEKAMTWFNTLMKPDIPVEKVDPVTDGQ